MTGFGRARGALSARFAASVVVRSVNHRYLDIQVRTNLREEVPEVEAAVRAVVARAGERGRVTVQVTLERTAPAGSRVMVDTAALAGVLGQLAAVELPAGVGRTLELRDALTVPGVVTVVGEETLLDADETARLEGLASEAAAEWAAMGASEGATLERHVREELEGLEEFLAWFEPRMGDFRQQVLSRVRDRIVELVGADRLVDPDRLLQEAATQSDRADVAEETVRLRSHLAAFRGRLDGGGAVGRALDFLCQEIHRELNTLGSKCREAGVADRLVDAKSSAERIREQIQNLA